MVRRTSVALAVALVGAAVATGCGNVGTGDQTPDGERAPITARAIAAVMLDHVSAKTTRREATYVDETSPSGYVGADFRYHGDGESDGDLVRVTLQRSRSLPACQGEQCAGTGGRRPAPLGPGRTRRGSGHRRPRAGA